MDRTELQKLRDLPIEGVAGRLGLSVSRHKCLCPFHDDHHASCSFSQARNTYRCWSCGASGGTIDLVMNLLGKDFLGACRWLSAETGVIQSPPLSPSPPPMGGVRGGPPRQVLPPRATGVFTVATECRYGPIKGSESPFATEGKESEGGFEGSWREAAFASHFDCPFLSEPARHFLFDQRRLDRRVVDWYRLNSWTSRDGTSFLELPYYSAEGRLIGVQNRRLSPDPSGKAPRFLFQPGSRTSAFGLQIIPYLRPTDELWIMEGPTDLLAAASDGHRGIAVASATLLRPEDFLPLRDRGILRWRMVHDNDRAGRDLRDQVVRLANQLGATIVATPPPDGMKDYGEYRAKRGLTP